MPMPKATGSHSTQRSRSSNADLRSQCKTAGAKKKPPTGSAAGNPGASDRKEKSGPTPTGTGLLEASQVIRRPVTQADPEEAIMTENKRPVLRFAPSPTGYLHIGGARTALFNWLYPRHTGGTFLLRIEDTDRQRSTEEAIAAILDGMSWLGLTWDGEPLYQFVRAPRHREIAEQLLAEGNAYRCYATAAELEEM